MPVPSPRRVTGRRTALASAEVWALTVVAHWTAGGELPSLPWLVGVAGLVAIMTGWVLRGQARPVVMAPVLVACQLGLHVLFASLGPSGHHAPHSHLAGGLTPRMLGAHVACAVLTAVVWWVRRSVVEVVLCLAVPLLVPTRHLAGAIAGGTARTTPVWLVGDPGRAPPRVLLALT